MKGQGAVRNVDNRFEANKVLLFWEEEWEGEPQKIFTEFTKVYPKTIVNKVKSKDLPFDQSLNPYQGCEHGCSYCYARPTHEFWALNAGVDFERKIMYKPNAATLLEKHFKNKNYEVKNIMLSGNTDCYQPAERKFKITRQILETCLKFAHPVSIITKNSLILRDLDILTQLAELNLVSVAISITTLDEELRRKLEPRTSSSINKLKVIEKLSENKIPSMVMMAPIIPSLNNSEIFEIAKQTSERGAIDFSYTLIRLNDAVEPIFSEWVFEHFPDRAAKILNQIKQIHDGNLGNKMPKERFKGSGVLAESIQNAVAMARLKYFKENRLPILNSKIFRNSNQLSIF